VTWREPPPWLDRPGGRGRHDPTSAGRPGPHRQSPVRREAVRAGRARGSRRHRGLRLFDRRSGDHGRLPFGRGRPRADPAGRLSAVGHIAADARLRRAGGTAGRPYPPLVLARDGEKAGQVRHMCSGQHTSLLLLCRINDWPWRSTGAPTIPFNACTRRRSRECQHQRGAAAYVDRRLRRPDVRLLAGGRGAGVRDAGRSERGPARPTRVSAWSMP